MAITECVSRRPPSQQSERAKPPDPRTRETTLNSKSNFPVCVFRAERKVKELKEKFLLGKFPDLVKHESFYFPL